MGFLWMGEVGQSVHTLVYVHLHFQVRMAHGVEEHPSPVAAASSLIGQCCPSNREGQKTDRGTLITRKLSQKKNWRWGWRWGGVSPHDLGRIKGGMERRRKSGVRTFGEAKVPEYGRSRRWRQQGVGS